MNITLLKIIVFISGFSYLFFTIKPKEDYYKKKLDPFFKYGFLVGLVLVAIASLNFEFIDKLLLLKTIITFLESILFYITCLTIGFGFFTFYFNREEVEEKIEREKEEEERGEKRRKEEFADKFPRINKVPILRHIVKWMYKEGWWYSLGLIFIVLLGFGLRIWNLGDLNLLVDEQFAYSAAKSLLNNSRPKVFFASMDFFGYLYYYRTILYTIPTYLFFKLFGVNEFNLRITAVLIGTSLIVLVYILGKKMIDKKFALLCSLTLAISAWAIMYSRYARHYILDSLIIILSLIILYISYLENQTKNVYKCYLILIPFILIPWIELNLLIIFFPIYFFILLKQKHSFFTNKHNYIIIIIIIFNLILSFSLMGSSNYVEDSVATASEDRYASCSSLNCKTYILAIGLLKGFSSLRYNNYFLTLIFSYYPFLFIFFFIGVLGLYFHINHKAERINFSFILIMLMILSFYDPWRGLSGGPIRTWEPKHFSYLIPSYFIFLLTAFYYLIKKNKIRYQLILIFLLVVTVFSLTPIYLSYGQIVKDTPYQTLLSANFYTNVKEPIYLIRDNFENRDLIIFDTMEPLYRSYFDKKPDLRIGWPNKKDYSNDEEYIYLKKKYNLIEDDPEILVKFILKSLENGSNVWLIESVYNDLNLQTRHRKGRIRKFLDSNLNCLIYSESYTRVYYFNKHCF